MDSILIVIPVHNRCRQTIDCLEQIKNFMHPDFAFEILVIDDGSTDGTAESIRYRFPTVEIHIGDGKLWWAGGVNAGLRRSLEKGADYVYLINDDNRFSVDTLLQLHKEIKRHADSVICSSVTLKTGTNSVLNCGFRYRGIAKVLRIIAYGDALSTLPSIVDVELFGSRSTLLPTKCIKEIGLFDNRRFPHHYSDLDYFARARRKGYKLLIVTASKVWTDDSPRYFWNMIEHADFNSLLKSYFDKRYNNNLPLLYHASYCDRNIVQGTLHLLRALSIQIFFLVSATGGKSNAIMKLLMRLRNLS